MLTVIKEVERRNKRRMFLCKCHCGNEVIVREPKRIFSCGCTRKDRHGMRRTPTYNTWQCMKNRCLNRKSSDFNRYGGRGVLMSSRWKSFKNFLEDMGERPKGATLDRVNNKDGYYKNNCRWATAKEQSRNTSSNVVLQFDGRKMTAAEWSEVLSIPRYCIYTRIKKGWSVDRTLTEPVHLEKSRNQRRNEDG